MVVLLAKMKKNEVKWSKKKWKERKRTNPKLVLKKVT
jgi:hypothetical protein